MQVANYYVFASKFYKYTVSVASEHFIILPSNLHTVVLPLKSKNTARIRSKLDRLIHGTDLLVRDFLNFGTGDERGFEFSVCPSSCWCPGQIAWSIDAWNFQAEIGSFIWTRRWKSSCQLKMIRIEIIGKAEVHLLNDNKWWL